MTYSKDRENKEAYREYLDKLAAVLETKYHLPALVGSPKQIEFAKDIRIKFLDRFDREKEKLSADERERIESEIVTKTMSRWWIDNKDASAKELLSGQNKQLTAGDGVVMIDTRNPETVRITGPKPFELAGILNEKEFTLHDGIWIRRIAKNDAGRTPVVESIAVALLAKGFTAKILAAEEEQRETGDGTLRIIAGKLCLETAKEHIYKAAVRIGRRRVWLDAADKAEIRKLVKDYDVTVTKEAQKVLGDEPV